MMDHLKLLNQPLSPQNIPIHPETNKHQSQNNFGSLGPGLVKAASKSKGQVQNLESRQLRKMSQEKKQKALFNQYLNDQLKFDNFPAITSKNQKRKIVIYRPHQRAQSAVPKLISKMERSMKKYGSQLDLKETQNDQHIDQKQIKHTSFQTSEPSSIERKAMADLLVISETQSILKESYQPPNKMALVPSTSKDSGQVTSQLNRLPRNLKFLDEYSSSLYSDQKQRNFKSMRKLVPSSQGIDSIIQRAREYMTGQSLDREKSKSQIFTQVINESPQIPTVKKLIVKKQRPSSHIDFKRSKKALAEIIKPINPVEQTVKFKNGRKTNRTYSSYGHRTFSRNYNELLSGSLVFKRKQKKQRSLTPNERIEETTENNFIRQVVANEQGKVAKKVKKGMKSNKMEQLQAFKNNNYKLLEIIEKAQNKKTIKIVKQPQVSGSKTPITQPQLPDLVPHSPTEKQVPSFYRNHIQNLTINTPANFDIRDFMTSQNLNSQQQFAFLTHLNSVNTNLHMANQIKQIFDEFKKTILTRERRPQQRQVTQQRKTTTTPEEQKSKESKSPENKFISSSAHVKRLKQKIAAPKPIDSSVVEAKQIDEETPGNEHDKLIVGEFQKAKKEEEIGTDDEDQQMLEMLKRKLKQIRKNGPQSDARLQAVEQAAVEIVGFQIKSPSAPPKVLTVERIPEIQVLASPQKIKFKEVTIGTEMVKISQTEDNRQNVILSQSSKELDSEDDAKRDKDPVQASMAFNGIQALGNSYTESISNQELEHFPKTFTPNYDKQNVNLIKTVFEGNRTIKNNSPAFSPMVQSNFEMKHNSPSEYFLQKSKFFHNFKASGQKLNELFEVESEDSGMEYNPSPIRFKNANVSIKKEEEVQEDFELILNSFVSEFATQDKASLKSMAVKPHSDFIENTPRKLEKSVSFGSAGTTIEPSSLQRTYFNCCQAMSEFYDRERKISEQQNYFAQTTFLVDEMVAKLMFEVYKMYNNIQNGRNKPRPLKLMKIEKQIIQSYEIKFNKIEQTFQIKDPSFQQLINESNEDTIRRKISYELRRKYFPEAHHVEILKEIDFKEEENKHFYARNRIQSQSLNTLLKQNTGWNMRVREIEKELKRYTHYVDLVWQNKHNKTHFAQVLNFAKFEEQVNFNISIFDIVTKCSLDKVDSEISWSQINSQTKKFEERVVLSDTEFERRIDFHVKNLVTACYRQYIHLSEELVKHLFTLVNKSRKIDLIFGFQNSVCTDVVISFFNKSIFSQRYPNINSVLFSFAEQQQRFNENINQLCILKQDKVGIPTSFKNAIKVSGFSGLINLNKLLFRENCFNVSLQLHCKQDDHKVQSKLQFLKKSITTNFKKQIDKESQLKFQRKPRRSASASALTETQQIFYLQRQKQLVKVIRYENATCNSEICVSDFQMTIRPLMHKNAWDPYNLKYQEHVLASLMQPQFHKVKDTQNLFYKNLVTLIDKKDPDYNELATTHFGYKCQLHRDPENLNIVAEVFVPCTLDKALSKVEKYETFMQVIQKKKVVMLEIEQDDVSPSYSIKKSKAKYSNNNIHSSIQKRDLKFEEQKPQFQISKAMSVVIDDGFNTDESMKEINLDDVLSDFSKSDQEKCSAEDKQSQKTRKKLSQKGSSSVKDLEKALLLAKTLNFKSSQQYYSELNKTKEELPMFKYVNNDDLIEEMDLQTQNEKKERIKVDALIKDGLRNVQINNNQEWRTQYLQKQYRQKVIAMAGYQNSLKKLKSESQGNQTSKLKVIVNQQGLKPDTKAMSDTFSFKPNREESSDSSLIDWKDPSFSKVNIFQDQGFKEGFDDQSELNELNEVKILQKIKDKKNKKVNDAKNKIFKRNMILKSFASNPSHKAKKQKKMNFSEFQYNLRLSKKMEVVRQQLGFEVNINLPTEENEHLQDMNDNFEFLVDDSQIQSSTISIYNSYQDTLPKQKLIEAVRLGQKGVMIDLFARFVFNKQIIDQKGMSVVIIATINKDFEMLKELLMRGQSPHCVDKDGNTALHYACSSQQKKIIDLLIKHGANEEVENKNGQSPWQMGLWCEL